VAKVKKRKAIIAINCSVPADGVRIFLDDFDTRKEAEESLMETVLQHLDYEIKEIEE